MIHSIAGFGNANWGLCSGHAICEGVLAQFGKGCVSPLSISFHLLSSLSLSLSLSLFPPPSLSSSSLSLFLPPPLLYFVWLPFHHYLPSPSDHRIIIGTPFSQSIDREVVDDDILLLVVEVMSTNDRTLTLYKLTLPYLVLNHTQKTVQVTALVQYTYVCICDVLTKP